MDATPPALGGGQVLHHGLPSWDFQQESYIWQEMYLIHLSLERTCDTFLVPVVCSFAWGDRESIMTAVSVPRPRKEGGMSSI